MLLRVLGGIDVVAGIIFLAMAMNVSVFLPLTLFVLVLLLLKGFFVFLGDKLSYVDLILSFMLLLSMFFNLPGILTATGSLILLAKGLASFA